MQKFFKKSVWKKISISKGNAIFSYEWKGN